MVIKTSKKITVNELTKEVRILRSFVIGLALKDPEGEYRPEFVRNVLKAAKEPATEEFISAKDFLHRLEQLEKNEI